MKLIDLIFQKTSLRIAAEKGNIDVLNLLLKIPDVDINARIILNFIS